jgi:hypothetical protein
LKGNPNMIRVDRERYLKHIVTDLETPTEPSSTKFLVLGNYSCDYDFDNFSPHMSNKPFTQKFQMIFQIDLLVAAK